jgi:hypothetical protein
MGQMHLEYVLRERYCHYVCEHAYRISKLRVDEVSFFLYCHVYW